MREDNSPRPKFRVGSRFSAAAAVSLAALMPVAACAVLAPEGASRAVSVEVPRVTDLATVPWEGGSEYWAQFPRTADAGWTDPAFFPVAVWHSSISTDADVAWDKGLGINTYIHLDPSTPYHLFEDNDVFWVGSALNDSFTTDARNWVGYTLDDEVDGRFAPKDGLAHLAELRNGLPEDRMAYSNFTHAVISHDMADSDAEAYVNRFTDVASVDMYWYTRSFCDAVPYRAEYLVTINQQSCRSSSSYGAVVEALRTRDAADGALQPLWQFVEMLNGGPIDGPFVRHIEPEELQGAVMNSLIHEARGIVYFIQSLSGPCQAGNATRAAQVAPDFCGAAQVRAAGEINAIIHELAPVLNTQSLVYDVGEGVDAMVKVYGQDLYIFAMLDAGVPPGQRMLTVPTGVAGTRADVLNEDRTIQLDGQGFTDNFAAEHSFHIYRVPLTGGSP